MAHELGHNLGLRHTNGGSEGAAGVGLIQIPGTPTTDSDSFMNAGTCGNSWTKFSHYDIVTFNYLWPKARYTVSFANNCCPSITVEVGSLLERSIAPESDYQIFSGWYEDRELTIPWNYGKRITGNLYLYPKWRYRTSPLVTYRKESYSTNQVSFTLEQTTGVTLTGQVCRGFNEWWEIAKYGGATNVAVGKSSTLIKVMYVNQYIQTSSTVGAFEHTERLVLEAGTYWLSASFPLGLGPQNGAFLKHGTTVAMVKY